MTTKVHPKKSRASGEAKSSTRHTTQVSVQSSARRATHRATKLQPLEFRVFQALRERPEIKGSRLLVACSGGVDSVALALILKRLSTRLGFELALAYVHHGETSDPRINTARMRAQKRVQRLATELGLEFFVNPPSGSSPTSEDALRSLRLKQLHTWREEAAFDLIALAHHKDDLLETRLIRLVRGTGPGGLVAMRSWDPPVMRPLLGESREAIEAYARAAGTTWINDPTNRSTEPLRNWMRRLWLPALETKRPGAREALARSLAQIADTLERREPSFEKYGIHLEERGAWMERAAYRQLGASERREGMALYLRTIGVPNFGASHVEEICKRLDTSRKNLTFQLLKLQWEVNAERILARPTRTRLTTGGTTDAGSFDGSER